MEMTENVYGVILKNVKALKEEPYVNNINNYRGAVKFELIGKKFPNSTYKNYSEDWNSVTKTIYELSSFGGELKKANYFKKDLAGVIAETNSKEEKIAAIFNFVKGKVKWNGFTDFYTHDGVKKAYKEGVGNVAEINLMLVAMLREAGVDASPILVSTRSHGVPMYPTRKGFNYVIVGVELLNRLILLDATEPYSLPNVLPKRVLNWQGRIIRKHGSSAFINLFPNVYSVDAKRLNVKMGEDGSINGSVSIVYKNLEALTGRRTFSKLSEESVIKKMESYLKPIEIEKIRLSNKNKLSKPFAIIIKYTADNQVEKINDKLYFSPLFFLAKQENVFKLEERKFPVDFASAWMENSEVIIQIPEGYKVEKVPEEINITTENNVGIFSYKITEKEGRILVKVSTKINTPIVPFNLYKELKELYTKRILKEKEKIVLIKEK